jgi:hypothetical protein
VALTRAAAEPLHLLNHVNLFGASYVAAVRSVLARFG